MASWKKVLTTDDLGEINNTNLGSHDLSQSDNTRIYEIGDTKDYLIFKNPDLALPNLLVLDNTTYRVKLEAMNGVQIGPSISGSNYLLPIGNTCGNKKFLVGTSTEGSEFKLWKDLFGPSGSITGGFVNWTTDDDDNPILDTDAATDTILVYNYSDEEFRHAPMTLIPTRVMYHFGLNSSVGTGETFLKGVNGVQHSADIGFVATRFLRLVGASFGWWKEDNGGGHRKQLRIYKNGSLVCSTTTFGGASPVLSFLTQYENQQTDVPQSGQDFSGAITFSPGDVISVSSFTSGAYSGSGNSLQATLEFV